MSKLEQLLKDQKHQKSNLLELQEYINKYKFMDLYSLKKIQKEFIFIELNQLKILKQKIWLKSFVKIINLIIKYSVKYLKRLHQQVQDILDILDYMELDLDLEVEHLDQILMEVVHYLEELHQDIHMEVHILLVFLVLLYQHIKSLQSNILH